MKIAILGCGWLGLKLGASLSKENHEVRGSVTRIEKMAELRQAGIIPYTIKIFEKGIQGDLRSFVSGCEILIVDIPPGLRKDPETDFVQKIRNIIPVVEKARLQLVIFTSSTTVYADDENFTIYSEDSETDNSNLRSVQLRNAELLFLNNDNFKSAILRFGGLISEDRHPVKVLAGKKTISNPKAPVNLVHREDCITAIKKVIKEGYTGVWNVVYPHHPSKEEYYQKKAQKFNLVTPQFDHSDISKGKIISSEKLQKKGFQFNYPIG